MKARQLPRARAGRPAHEPTEERRVLIERMAAAGINHDLIAEVVGLCGDTLRKHYRSELDNGRERVTAKVCNSLIEKALSDRPDAVNAAKFYLQSQAGWAERSESTVTHRHEDRVQRRKEALERHREQGRNGDRPGANSRMAVN